MSWLNTRIGKVAQGTAIALITWGVLHLTREYLGRTAAMIAAGLILAIFILGLVVRARLAAGGRPPS